GSLAAHPWWFYGPRLAFDLLPWSLLLPLAAWLMVRQRWWQQDAEARLGLVWLLAMVLVLSCSRFKRADYLLPAYPGAALFRGCAAERCYRELRYRTSLITGGSMIVGGVALGWWIYLGHV